MKLLRPIDNAIKALKNIQYQDKWEVISEIISTVMYASLIHFAVDEISLKILSRSLDTQFYKIHRGFQNGC